MASIVLHTSRCRSLSHSDSSLPKTPVSERERLYQLFNEKQRIESKLRNTDAKLSTLNEQLRSIEAIFPAAISELTTDIRMALRTNKDEVRSVVINRLDTLIDRIRAANKTFDEHSQEQISFEAELKHLRELLHETSGLCTLGDSDEEVSQQLATLRKVKRELSSFKAPSVDTSSVRRSIDGKFRKQTTIKQRLKIKLSQYTSKVHDVSKIALLGVISQELNLPDPDEKFLYFLDPTGRTRVEVLRTRPDASLEEAIRQQARVLSATIKEVGGDVVAAIKGMSLKWPNDTGSFRMLQQVLSLLEILKADGSDILALEICIYYLATLDKRGGLQVGYLLAQSASDEKAHIALIALLKKALAQYSPPYITKDSFKNLDEYFEDIHTTTTHLPSLSDLPHLLKLPAALNKKAAKEFADQIYIDVAEIYQLLTLTTIHNLREVEAYQQQLKEVLRHFTGKFKQEAGFLLMLVNNLVNHGEFYASWTIFSHLQSIATFSRKSKEFAQFQELQELFDLGSNCINMRNRFQMLPFAIPPFTLVSRDLAILSELKSGEEFAQAVEYGLHWMQHKEATALWAQTLRPKAQHACQSSS